MPDVVAFERDGFLKIRGAGAHDVADAARHALWRQIGLAEDRPDQWTQPVVWTSDLTGAGVFGELAGSRPLAAALDAICGARGWRPRGALGNIPVRFPVVPPNDDRGWHIDLNTPQPDGTWAVTGRPHTVLVLTLLSEVGPDDAPTRIRVGSHRNVATVLGERALDAVEAGALVETASATCEVVLAAGDPGDMFILHPFTVHAADVHRGHMPRFMAQGPVLLSERLTPDTPSPLASAWHRPTVQE